MALTPQAQIRNSLNRLIRQPDGDSIKYNEDSTLEATVVYKCSWLDLLRLMPRKNKSKHPDFNNLTASDVQATREAPGIAVLTVKYTGPSFSGRDSGFQNTSPADTDLIEYSTSLRQEPIQTHPDFETIVGTADEPNEANKPKFDEDGNFERFDDDSPLVGLESWYVPTTTLRKTYVSITPPASLGGIGQIDTPTGAASPPGSRNWLNAGLNVTLRGSLYYITEEYWLSGPKGWNDQIYS